MRQFWVLVLCAALLFSACSVRRHVLHNSEEAELLAEERGRLLQLTDPVQKTKSYITISSILLDFATSLASDGNMDGMKTLLVQYQTTIQDASDTMINSDRDARTNPAGFRDLDEALRPQVSRLKALKERVTPVDRQPVDTALSTANSARERILKLLSF